MSPHAKRPLPSPACLPRRSPPPPPPGSLSCDTDDYGLGVVSMANPAANITCPPGCLSSSGSIYGSKNYTSDSHICKAAIHAGALPASGGRTTVYWLPGQGVYIGTGV